MLKLQWSLVFVSLIVLGSSVTAQAQVEHRVHVGGPDICDAIGESPGCDKNFSLMAMEFRNGKVVGQYTDRLAGGGGFHAVIDCLSVDGNDAWVSGIITHGSIGDLDLAGMPVGTRVRDNGKSRKDPADEISFSFIGDETPCDEQPDHQLFAVPQGQVVVK